MMKNKLSGLKRILLITFTSALIGTSCMENKRIEKEERQVWKYEDINNVNSPRKLITLEDAYFAHYTGHYETGTKGEKLLSRNLMKTDTIRVDSIDYKDIK
jgi:hypothetical protein